MSTVVGGSIAQGKHQTERTNIMTSKIHKRLAILTAILIMAITIVPSITAQRGGLKTGSRMLYHDGPVMKGASHVYVVYYGCWSCGMPGTTLDSQVVIGNLVSSLGLSPYFRINTTYPDSTGEAPNGALVFGGAVSDNGYAHGNELTVTDISAIITDHFLQGTLPQDPAGIYLVFASPDVSSVQTGFCNAGYSPYHSQSVFMGTPYRYAFIGNAMRCPTTAGPQFIGSDGSLLPTPNGDFAGDSMAAIAARALNMIVTNPAGTGWYDRYNFENSEKCQGMFGTTYTTANGARANIRLQGRDYLIDQNWVNDRRGYCSLSYP
jgi:hypothetical protein